MNIPEIESLQREVNDLKMRLSSVSGELPEEKDLYSLWDLALLMDMPYSTFRQNPNLRPENPFRPKGKRAVYRRSDVEDWLKSIGKKKE